MEKPFACKNCRKSFTTISNYKRHNITHHEEKTKQYQCWHCPKTFVRNDNARKHALRVHGDQERRTVEVSTRNKKWTPNVFKPGPWNPPPEARTRATVYRIEIPGGKIISQINSTKCKRRIFRLNPYIALTQEEALVTLESQNISTVGRMNQVQLLTDLNITPSSSTETILQDEEGICEQRRPEATRVYGIFETTKD